MSWDQPKDLYDFIKEVVYDRVYKFNYEQIDAVLKDKMTLLELDGYHSMYYHNSLLSILKYLEDKHVLIYRNDFYVPVDTMLKEEYLIETDMMAYSTGLVMAGDLYMDDVEELFDVSTCEAVSRIKADFVKPIILTGYLVKDMEYLQPDVSLEELHFLYNKFIEQGATVDETMQYILNYYNAISLNDRFLNKSYPNRYKISSRVKKKF